MGAERRSMVMSDDEKRLTAYHEAGHAIVGRSVPIHDPVYKVSDHPARSGARGDHVPARRGPLSYSRTWLESQYLAAYGGRIAEELIFGARGRHHRCVESDISAPPNRSQHGDQVGHVGPAWVP